MMDRSPDPATPVSLLGRLRLTPDDPGVWADFVMMYGHRIYQWAKGFGLRSEDAEDVTQTVLLKLAVRLREFEYDPSRSFRSWLKTITHHAWHDQTKRVHRFVQGSGSPAVQALLESVEERRSLADELEKAFDLELLREAMQRVQLRVEKRTWDAFRLLALENVSGADAAKQLAMKVATVFVARSKVQRLLRDELNRLEAS